MPEGIIIRPYTAADVPQMAEIWNEVVRDGVAFPQTEELGAAEAAGVLAQPPRALSLSSKGRLLPT